MELLHKGLSDEIIKGFYSVYNKMGYGFLERVYQNALYLELISRGLQVEVQKKIRVYYNESLVGLYYPDLTVNDFVILELKASDFILKEHETQLINYLRGTRIEVGFLLNFGKRPEFRRKVFENSRK